MSFDPKKETTKTELQAQCKGLGIKYSAKDNKDTLLAHVAAHHKYRPRLHEGVVQRTKKTPSKPSFHKFNSMKGGNGTPPDLKDVLPIVLWNVSKTDPYMFAGILHDLFVSDGVAIQDDMIKDLEKNISVGLETMAYFDEVIPNKASIPASKLFGSSTRMVKQNIANRRRLKNDLKKIVTELVELKRLKKQKEVYQNITDTLSKNIAQGLDTIEKHVGNIIPAVTDDIAKGFPYRSLVVNCATNTIDKNDITVYHDSVFCIPTRNSEIEAEYLNDELRSRNNDFVEACTAHHKSSFIDARRDGKTKRVFITTYYNIATHYSLVFAAYGTIDKMIFLTTYRFDLPSRSTEISITEDKGAPIYNDKSLRIDFLIPILNSQSVSIHRKKEVAKAFDSIYYDSNVSIEHLTDKILPKISNKTKNQENPHKIKKEVMGGGHHGFTLIRYAIGDQNVYYLKDEEEDDDAKIDDVSVELRSILDKVIFEDKRYGVRLIPEGYQGFLDEEVIGRYFANVAKDDICILTYV